jgi:type IV secretion system protein VirB2
MSFFSRVKSSFLAARARHAVAIAGAAMLVAPSAFASTGLPWDSAVTTIRNNLTGPVATAISVVAFLAAGAALVFGGDELGNIAKRLLYIVLGIALIVLGNQFLTTLGLTNSGGLI